MKLLAFDTSTEVMSIAVQNGEQIFTHSGAGGAHTSATLIPAIQGLMQQAGLQFAQLDAIAFGRGPGSFTGLRTACSVAQGLAFAAKVKVLPMDTLMVLAHGADSAVPAGGTAATTGKPRVVCAALDARMGELYYAYYALSAGTCQALSQVQLHTPAAMALLGGFKDTLLAGNVRPAYNDQLSPAMLAAPYCACLPSASAMLRLAPQRIAAGALVDAQNALPLYIRDKVAQTTAEREGAAAIATKNATAPL
jgi:tRNA threonylcarbamoyladenosine biosynthesis protein TsaB